MKKFIYIILAAGVLAACRKDDTDSGAPAKEIVTLQVKDVFYNCATMQGIYTRLTGGVTAQGFVLSESPLDGSNSGQEYLLTAVQEGKFALPVEELQRKTTYYVKAFVARGTGERIYGNPIKFQTDSLQIDPPGVPTGSVAILDGKTVSVVEKGSTLGNESMSTAEKTSVPVKPADYGMYYWTDDQGRDNADRFSLGEAFANLYAITDNVSYQVGGLKPGTTYNYVLYIRSGAYFSGNKWKSVTKEVEGAPGTFTTVTLTPPAAATADPSNVTPTSVVLSGVFQSNGNDPDAKYGIEYGTSSANLDTKIYAAGIANELLQRFDIFVKGLAPNSTYYYRAFAENDDFSEGSSDVRSFTTDAAGKPVVGEYLLDYEFRLERYKVNSVVLRATLLSDGGAALTSKGFYYGTSTDAISQKLTASGDVVSDGVYDYYEVELGSLAEGIVYFKPFAANQYGETVYGEVCQIRTAVDGGLLYYLDKNKGSVPSYNNMALSGTRLTYFELDPVTSGSTVYYMLDRNLGSTRTYTPDMYDKAFQDAETDPALFEAAGYYYQFDRALPSSSPDVQITTNMGYGAGHYVAWINTANLFDPAMNTGATWDNAVCPQGYDLPTSEEMKAIVSAIQPAIADQTLPKLFDAMRFGTTGWRAPANGNMQNGSKVNSEIWLKDAGSNATNAQAAMIDAPPAGRFSINTGRNRYTGRPVRCIRKVTID